MHLLCMDDSITEFTTLDSVIDEVTVGSSSIAKNVLGKMSRVSVCFATYTISNDMGVHANLANMFVQNASLQTTRTIFIVNMFGFSKVWTRTVLPEFTEIPLLSKGFSHAAEPPEGNTGKNAPCSRTTISTRLKLINT